MWGIHCLLRIWRYIRFNFVKDKDIEYVTWDIGKTTNYCNIWNTNTTSSTIIVTRTKEYTEFKEKTIGTNFANSVGGLTDSCVVEFDYWQLDGLSNTFMQVVKDSTQVTSGGMNLGMLNGELEKWHHIKLTIQNNLLTVVNETNGASFTKNLLDTPNRFNFWSSGNITTIRFKNFIISKR